MGRLWDRIAEAALARLGGEFRREDVLAIALGIVGLVLVASHLPFGWSLPEYATY